jgi:hypothetical protein
LQNQFNGDTNSKLCYSTFLGEKEEKTYVDLLFSLIKDPEFLDMFEEFKGRDRLSLDFEELTEDKQIEILIKCFFIVLIYFNSDKISKRPGH